MNLIIDAWWHSKLPTFLLLLGSIQKRIQYFSIVSIWIGRATQWISLLRNKAIKIRLDQLAWNAYYSYRKFSHTWKRHEHFGLNFSYQLQGNSRKSPPWLFFFSRFSSKLKFLQNFWFSFLFFFIKNILTSCHCFIWLVVEIFGLRLLKENFVVCWATLSSTQRFIGPLLLRLLGFDFFTLKIIFFNQYLNKVNINPHALTSWKKKN